MRNILLTDRTAQEIDAQVAKVLRGLGNPEPPLRLEDVRELLRLDRHYFSSTDDDCLREMAHRMRIAGKQVLLRPSLLLDVVKKLSLKALFVPDRKRILIDLELPAIKQRWGESHEVVHSLIPWHQDLMHGDDKHTLLPACEEQVEAEANYGAGRLLFLQGRFDEAVRGSPLTLDQVKKLSGQFRNSITSGLWRAVEQSDAPAVGLVTGHPHHRIEAPAYANPCRHFIRSRRFAAEFSGISEVHLCAVLKTYCRYVSKGPLGGAEVSLPDDAGVEHVFTFETFSNSYDALTLGLHRGPRRAVSHVGPLTSSQGVS